MGISITVLTQERVADADRIFRSAFEIEESRKAGIRQMLKLQPDGYFMAFFDGKPAGMVGAVDYGRYAYVGMMAVEKKFQRKGIGVALMRRLMEWVDQCGIPAVYLDATPSGARIYRRFGFKPHDLSHLYVLRNPPEASMSDKGIHPVTTADVKLLKRFDTPIFGADRSRLFYLILEVEPSRAYLSHDDGGAVDGFIFARMSRIGPWAARSEKTARRLLHAVLRLSFHRPPTIVVPGANAQAATLLEKCGFSHMVSNCHMRRGQSAYPDQRELIYGQSSFAEG